jgi:S-adenosylmethionine-diacylglycerol 3-amino-3-carboxypropyl transferase
MPKTASHKTAAHATGTRLIEGAVVRHESPRRARLLDKAFAMAFKGLVYAQIWEDPVADMDALRIGPDSRIITIASGGCNALSYLTADPEAVTCVDLNTAHIALNKLKHAAVRHLPDYAHLRRFIAEADHPSNVETYKVLLAPHLDEATRRYWEGRDLVGRRRIGAFTRGIYKHGLLGNFIGLAHVLARLYRIDPAEILGAGSLEDQRRVFEERFAPIFERRLVRWLTKHPASLFGLGIPPAQYTALAGEQRMSDVLRARLEKLACHFPVNDNYFAWQAFGRGYGRGAEHPLPPYLQRDNLPFVRERLDRLSVRHANFTQVLAEAQDRSYDRYILLDAQDWMSDEQLTELWSQITRTARPGSRVLFRTAAEPSLLPGRVPDDILSRWEYREAESQAATLADRSSIYGGVHLYVLHP